MELYLVGVSIVVGSMVNLYKDTPNEEIEYFQIVSLILSSWIGVGWLLVEGLKTLEE